MKTTKNTVLITGGSAGIGLELAKQFEAAGNKVIITGRDAARLKKALDQLPGVTGIVSDVSRAEDVDKLVARIATEFPTLNVVINNAGRAFVYNLAQTEGAYAKAAEEMETNYLSVIRLNEKLLPILRQQPEAAIVDVSSIVAYTPNHILATYSATKAALHSYTVSLRHSLTNTSVKVFELMPPLVNTEFSHEIGGAERGIPPSVVAEDLLKAFEHNDYEVRVGNTAYIYELSRKSPDEAFAVLNPA
jgi:uncharacterized oxidoreductase